MQISLRQSLPCVAVNVCGCDFLERHAGETHSMIQRPRTIPHTSHSCHIRNFGPCNPNTSAVTTHLNFKSCPIPPTHTPSLICRFCGSPLSPECLNSTRSSLCSENCCHTLSWFSHSVRQSNR